MRQQFVRPFAVLGVIGALLAVPAVAAAQSGGAAASSTAGGAMTRERPVVQRLVCAQGRTARCRGGQVLKLRGSSFSDVALVIFRGGKGASDDRAAKPTERSPHRILVQVPQDAKSGKVQVRSAATGVSRSGPVLRVPAMPALRFSIEGGAAVFPIAGPHQIGTTVAQRFGGPRGHQGQDTFAACGTPLVAAQGGVVQHKAFEARAGNYLVIGLPDKTSEVYMHMRSPSPLAEGDPVAAGQPIGEVGDTGDAEGCHLHFELWTAPGWYKGGTPIDPLPLLQRLPGA